MKTACRIASVWAVVLLGNLLPAAAGDLLTLELPAAVPRAGARFGDGVSIAADGSRALVGVAAGQLCPDGVSTTCKAAHVYVRNGDVWMLEATLRVAERGLWAPVALSPDGSVALLGAPGAACPVSPFTGCGAVYVFVRSGTSWTQERRIVDEGLATPSDRFGASLALSTAGDTALVGVPANDCEGGLRCGTVFVYRRAGGAWTLEDELVAADDATSQIGAAVAITPDGNTVLAGANLIDCAAGSFCGAAYVFTRSGGVWTQSQKLTASDPGAQDGFGSAVALSAAAETALVGSGGDDCAAGLDCGAVYVFARSGGPWTEQRKLTAPDGAPGDRFGGGVALQTDGATAWITAPLRDCSLGEKCTALYRSVRQTGTWSEPLEAAAFASGPVVPFPLPPLAAGAENVLVGVPATPCASGEDCGAAFVLGPAPAVEVPAVDGAGLAVLAGLLAAGGAVLLRRRRETGLTRVR